MNNTNLNGIAGKRGADVIKVPSASVRRLLPPRISPMAH
jgi:hypothetical protein